jgi:hypothetical protein
MCEHSGMAQPSSPDASPDLGSRLAQLGRRLGEREAAHGDALERARRYAGEIHADVARALERFHTSVAEAGAPHLSVELGDVHLDDKHLRAVEFDLTRGRYKAIIVAKAQGELTLVGPFKVGKVEGPCLSFPFAAEDEIRAALVSFLERFVEEAATP